MIRAFTVHNVITHGYKKEPRSAAYPVCVVSRRGPRGEPWLQQVQVFFIFYLCNPRLIDVASQYIVVEIRKLFYNLTFFQSAVELINKNKSMIHCGTVSGWQSGSAFGSDTKGRRFKSLKIKDLLVVSYSLQAKPLCC